MMSNSVALLTGIALALYVIFRFRKTRLERKPWVYPLLLATFPVYYWAFAGYAADYAALAKELLVGAVFIALAYVTFRIKSATGALLLAAGYLAHALYDALHASLFVNAGMPDWWPAFCGAVDGLIGVYLCYLALSMQRAGRSAV